MRKKIALAICVFVCAVIFFGWHTFRTTKYSKPVVGTDIPIALDAAASAEHSRTRRVYEYSLIPGGFLGAAEFRQKIKNDPLLLPLFASFDWAHARVVRSAGGYAYVSFRKDEKIYWTKHTVRIRAGEEILTDGVQSVLTRCGNEVSLVPEAPSEYVPSRVLDTFTVVPEAPTVSGEALPLYSSPPQASMSVPAPVSAPAPIYNSLPPTLYPPYCCIVLAPQPHVPVSEPSTLVMLSEGLVGLICGCLFLRKRQQGKTEGQPH